MSGFDPDAPTLKAAPSGKPADKAEPMPPHRVAAPEAPAAVMPARNPTAPRWKTVALVSLCVNAGLFIKVWSFVGELRDLTRQVQDINEHLVYAQQKLDHIALEDRLKVIETSMDERTARMERAIEAKADLLDKKMQASEDRFIKRLETDLPPALEKYLVDRLTKPHVGTR